jgi:hypothetical protein
MRTEVRTSSRVAAGVMNFRLKREATRFRSAGWISIFRLKPEATIFASCGFRVQFVASAFRRKKLVLHEQPRGALEVVG